MGPGTPVRRRVIVRGDVQGVGYRASCARQAGVVGVAGWVRNRFDGSVEAVFEGASANVETLIEWCRIGPRMARVTQVIVHDEDPEGIAGFITASSI
ncbi:MAG: acylphosphatase [Acidimicrobiia bacterium]